MLLTWGRTCSSGGAGATCVTVSTARAAWVMVRSERTVNSRPQREERMLWRWLWAEGRNVHFFKKWYFTQAQARWWPGIWKGSSPSRQLIQWGGGQARNKVLRRCSSRTFQKFKSYLSGNIWGILRLSQLCLEKVAHMKLDLWVRMCVWCVCYLCVRTRRAACSPRMSNPQARRPTPVHLLSFKVKS